MNFLAHHFFYASDDPYHNTGLILPDWSRSALGKRKLEWERKTQSYSPFIGLWEGCKKHYEADGWFHDCGYFNESTKEIEKDLVKLQSQGLLLAQRKWFLAHILSEVLLDRLIIEQFPEALDHFYQDLNQVPLSDIKDFLLESGKESMGRFPQGHAGFLSSEFLRFYSTADGLTESLNRVVQRTNQAAFSKEERQALTSIMPSWIAMAAAIKKPLQMERLSV